MLTRSAEPRQAGDSPEYLRARRGRGTQLDRSGGLGVKPGPPAGHLTARTRQLTSQAPVRRGTPPAMFYAPKHSARKAKPVRRRIAGVAVAGAATVAGGMATATASSASTSAVWDRVFSCNNTANSAIYTGNGYYGGLQFSDSTWD